MQNYIDILEQTFVLYTLSSYSKNLANELKKSKKYYLYDLGIRNSIIKNLGKLSKRQDLGTILESYVLHYLLSIRNEASTDIHFWRTNNGDEVDFIWLENQNPIPIEVKTTWNKQELSKGLKSFLKAYPKTEAAIILYYQSQTLDNFEGFYYKDYKCYLINISNLDLLHSVLEKK